MVQDKCDDALDAVQAASIGTSHDDTELAEIRQALATSLRAFTKCSSKAIKRLYAGPKRAKGVYEDTESEDSDVDDHLDNHLTADLDGLHHGPNETVFLIYLWVPRRVRG